MLTQFSKLPVGTRFNFAEADALHYVKVSADIADVFPSHRRHSRAPACGFVDVSKRSPGGDPLVCTFDDRPLQWRVFNNHITNRAAMLELARTFEAVREFYPDNGAPFDPDALATTAMKFSSGEIAVARFLLTLWNPGHEWKCGRFDLINDTASMGDADRKALCDWLLAPWWP